MIKSAIAYVSMFGSASVMPSVGGVKGETLNEVNYQVNEYITVLSSYYGAISKKQSGTFLEAEVSKDIEDGDMLIMFIATSGGVQKEFPHGFDEIISVAKGKGDLTIKAAFKIWRSGDPLMYPVPKQAKNYFVSLATLRGPKFILDAKARINTAEVNTGMAVTPRVETAVGGAVLSGFAYSDPHSATVLDQETIVSMTNGDDAMAVGIGSSEGGLSKKIKAIGETSERGGGDDIAMAIAIY